VHAAAIIKAHNKGEDWLSDLVYSGVPASMVGRRQVIEISHVSGMSNVKYWLREHGYNADDEDLCKMKICASACSSWPKPPITRSAKQSCANAARRYEQTVGVPGRSG
jgi:hypothetical protein